MSWSQVLGGVLFKTEIPPEEIKRNKRYSSLPHEYQSLHDKITHVLLSFYGNERVEHETLISHSVYKVIFRRSKSWETVNSMLISLHKTVDSTDAFALAWINKWLATIDLLKYYKKEILDSENEDQRKIIREDILKILDKEKIGLLEPIKPPGCEKVIQYLQDNWRLLILFSEWEEVSMKEEKLHVRIVPESEFDPSKIQAPTSMTIFTVEEEDSEITIDEDDDRFRRTKKVRVTVDASDETEEENPEKTPPTSMKRSDSYYKMSGAEHFDYVHSSGDESKKASDKKMTKDFLKLCEMVQLAVDNTNVKLKLPATEKQPLTVWSYIWPSFTAL